MFYLKSFLFFSQLGKGLNMAISKNSIENLKTSTDIIDIVSNYIEVRKAGANFKALCPFHGEKTPSFVLSPTKQIYHCFSCGVGGDVIKFVQEYEKLSFVESVEKIAMLSNFTLEYEEGRDDSSYRAYDVINALFLQYIKDNLKDEHREYLYGRGFTDETIAKFEIGFCPRGADELLGVFAQNFVTMEHVEDIGVMGTFKNRKFCSFSSRLTFPIKNQNGKVVGFVGRDLTGKSKAKYKNSKESKLFSKSSLLYGFDLARDEILQKKKKWLILEEGQIDVQLSYQVGIKNVSALQGTALTQQHIKMIKKLNVKVLLATDGDKAGVASAFKSAVLLSQNNIDGGVAIFKEGSDPADMVAKGKVDELKEIFKKGTKNKLIVFVLDEIAKRYNLHDAFDRSRGVEEAMSFLKSLDAVVGSFYVSYLNKIFNVNCSLVERPIIEPISHKLNTPVAGLEENILYTLSEEPWYVDEFIDILSIDYFKNKTLYEYVINFNMGKINKSGIALLRDICILSKEGLMLGIKELLKKSNRQNITNFERALEYAKSV